MSPIDDELRRLLAARADDAALHTDPLAGIEREAKSIRRRRTGTSVLGAAVAVALVALAVPAIRGSLDTDARKDRFAATPTATPSGTPNDEAFDPSGDRPVNAYPWHREVSAAGIGAVLRTWRALHPDVVRVGGQGLWSGTVPQLTGDVVALQIWPSDTGGDAHTVFAVVDGGRARIFADDITFFNEQRPGEGASVTKYDVNRSTYAAAALITSIFDDPKSAYFVVVVTPPAITSVQIATGLASVVDDASTLDTTSGGAGAALNGIAAISTFRGTEPAYSGRVSVRPISLLAGDPLAWPTRGDSALGESLYSGAYQALQNRFNGQMGGAHVLWAGRDGSHVVALVIGEYAGHGYTEPGSAYVVGAWVGDDSGGGALFGLHDVGFAIASADALLPATSPVGHALVLAVGGGIDWQVAYQATDASPRPEPTSFSSFVVTVPQPATFQVILARSDGGRGEVARDVGAGQTFPDR